MINRNTSIYRYYHTKFFGVYARKVKNGTDILCWAVKKEKTQFMLTDISPNKISFWFRALTTSSIALKIDDCETNAKLLLPIGRICSKKN